MSIWFENWASWDLKVQQKDSTGFRVPSWKVLFNIQKYVYFCKVNTLDSEYSHLVFIYIIGYNNISLRPDNPPLQNMGGSQPLTTRIDAYGRGTGSQWRVSGMNEQTLGVHQKGGQQR